jgi:hypothetical protein
MCKHHFNAIDKIAFPALNFIVGKNIKAAHVIGKFFRALGASDNLEYELYQSALAKR